jgi:hypothetical protein
MFKQSVSIYIDFSSQIFYTSQLADMAALICLYITFRNRRINKIYKNFAIYAGMYFSITLVDLNFFSLPFSKNVLIFEEWDNLFTLLELIVYTLFFIPLFSHTQKNTLKLILPAYVVFFIVFTLISSHEHNSFRATKNLIYTIESLIIMMYCVFYYINLFKKKPELNLKRDASFWITTGIFCMLIGMLPFSIAETYLIRAYRHSWVILSIIYNVLYIFNFITIIYSCISAKNEYSSKTKIIALPTNQNSPKLIHG